MPELVDDDVLGSVRLVAICAEGCAVEEEVSNEALAVAVVVAVAAVVAMEVVCTEVIIKGGGGTVEADGVVKAATRDPVEDSFDEGKTMGAGGTVDDAGQLLESSEEEVGVPDFSAGASSLSNSSSEELMEIKEADRGE